MVQETGKCDNEGRTGTYDLTMKDQVGTYDLDGNGNEGSGRDLCPLAMKDDPREDRVGSYDTPSEDGHTFCCFTKIQKI